MSDPVLNGVTVSDSLSACSLDCSLNEDWSSARRKGFFGSGKDSNSVVRTSLVGASLRRKALSLS